MNVNIVAPWQGKLKWVGKPVEGTSNTTGNPWKRVDFVISFINGQMQEENLCFSMSGVEKVNRLLGTPLGTEIIVTWRPAANEYQGKWYPKLDAIGFRPAQQTAPQQAPQQPYQQPYQQPQGYAPQQPVQNQGYAPNQGWQQQGGFTPAPAKPNEDMPFL